jgi:two-component system chemotaxis response regulator CheY
VRAIVIDDSRAIRSILGGMLREMGFEVSEAVDGRDALMNLKANDPPDLAMLDWNMPEMNGFDLLQRVRANRAFDSMRIVMVTTETEMSQMVRALEAGANEYVMKPFTRDVIRDKLQLLGMIQDDVAASSLGSEPMQ